MTTSPSATQRAAETGSTAADEGKRVGNVAKEEAASVAGEAKQQARSLVDEALSQVSDQTRTGRDRLVETLRSVGDDLQAMVEQSGRTGLGADLARQAGERAHALSSHMDGREPGDLLDEVRDFARRKPGTFLLGALAAGVVTGRLARGAKQARSDSGTQALGGSSSYGTTSPHAEGGYMTSGPGYQPSLGSGYAGTGTGSVPSADVTEPPSATGTAAVSEGTGYAPGASQAPGPFGSDVPDSSDSSRIGGAGGSVHDESSTGYPRSTP